ncbi:hypothetical protein [Truepera radiovictrix]|uniref:Uncharacterized protein n=1 Tax=Truepera radiovictrix (strain DSM 17093 / CIP 108686 / LMG 22925 / RQ-24) TaxID=649638 RepID=D7CTY9_TRURR|nr:hypothetical protein [Truepera radiovictrix]ADI15686.1 hypothetical protein Trad_2580 [Truepera radiovictrix DSM 17093]
MYLDFHYDYAQDRMRELLAEARAARMTPSFRSRLARALRRQPKRPVARTPQRSL